MFGFLTRRGCQLSSTRLLGCPLQLRHASDSTAARAADYTCIKVGVDQAVGTITISRPKQLNALNSQARYCTPRVHGPCVDASPTVHGHRQLQHCVRCPRSTPAAASPVVVLRRSRREMHTVNAEWWPNRPCPGLEPLLAWQAMTEVVDAARRLEPQVAAIVITGDGRKAFAAGADIKELAQLTYEQVASGCSTHRLWPAPVAQKCSCFLL